MSVRMHRAIAGAIAATLTMGGCSDGQTTAGGPPQVLGASDDGSSSGWDPITASSSSSPGDGSSGKDPGTDETGEPPGTGACETNEDCVATDPAPCTAQEGVCEFENCFFDDLPAGTECTSDTGPGVCDELGECIGNTDCSEGRGDCNGDPTDGCEADLGSDDHCGACGNACVPGANVESSTCTQGECESTCAAPWEDCDGDPENGCEIPTGLPNQCDANGLNDTTGCWTAHCGQSANADARNFGTWYCFECTNCNEPFPGIVKWCSHSSGLWFPEESGSCVVDSIDYEDLVCSP